MTGAFGFTGKYLTRRLLSMGKRVTTLTGHPDRQNPFGDQINVAPLDFGSFNDLVKSLRGATDLYNTYWVRFSYGKVTFDQAIQNTKTLINAAKEAGVGRIVHISITNASTESPLPYFRGKGIVEKAIMDSGLSYAIIRPTVIFGAGDILINNIAWFLRRFPVFPVFGSGQYRVQPVYVKDVAAIAVREAARDADTIMDAVGPETFTFEQLVRLIAERVHSRARMIHMRPGLALLFSRLVGYVRKDVILTRDEVEGLMSNLLVSPGPATAETRLSHWLDRNAGSVGTKYASELDRHYR